MRAIMGLRDVTRGPGEDNENTTLVFDLYWRSRHCTMPGMNVRTRRRRRHNPLIFAKLESVSSSGANSETDGTRFVQCDSCNAIIRL